MSSIFPSNPTLGQTFNLGTITYVWNGTAWIKSPNVTLSAITGTTSLYISSNTNSTSTTTGAITTPGGVGIGGSIVVGGTITAIGGYVGLNPNRIYQGLSEVTVTDNSSTHRINITVSSTTNMLFAGTSTTAYQQFSMLNTNNATSTQTGALTVLGGVGIGKDLWANSIYANTALQTQLLTVNGPANMNGVVHIYNATSATSSSTGALIVSGGTSVQGDLWLGGQLYIGGHNALTTQSFAESFSAGTDIYVVSEGTSTLQINNVSTLETVTGRGNTTDHPIAITNFTNAAGTSTGALVVSGGAVINQDLIVGGNIYAPNLALVDAIFASNQISVNTTNAVIIDTYDLTQFRSAKYLVQVTSGAGSSAQFQVIEILLLVDNNNVVYATEYGLVTTNGSLGEFAADSSGGIVSLYFTANSPTSKVIDVQRTALVPGIGLS